MALASLVESAAYNSATDQIDLEPFGAKKSTSNGFGNSRGQNEDADFVDLPPIEGRDPLQHLGRPEPAMVLFFEVIYSKKYQIPFL